MNSHFFKLILLICPLLGTACTATNAVTNNCDDVIAYFDQFSKEYARENLKVETLPEVVSDATEGSEGTLYRDNDKNIRLFELVHYGETGKQLVSYTIRDEQNYRVNISRLVYEKPINTADSPVIKDRLEKRIDTCDGVQVDVYTDRPESDELRTYPLNEMLQLLPNVN